MEEDDNIFQEIWKRFKKPWCISFSLYFAIVIIFFGSAGVWLPILRDGGIIDVSSFCMNVITYSCALIVPAFVSICLSVWNFKNKVSLVIFITTMLVVVAITIGYTIFGDSLIDAIICFIISLVLWVIANCENEEMNDNKFNESIKEGTKSVSKDWE